MAREFDLQGGVWLRNVGVHGYGPNMVHTNMGQNDRFAGGCRYRVAVLYVALLSNIAFQYMPLDSMHCRMGVGWTTLESMQIPPNRHRCMNEWPADPTGRATL